MPSATSFEWMIPPLWPWKVIMLPARGPRPTLKVTSVLTLRLMDDVQVTQVTQRTVRLAWHFFSQPRNESYNQSQVAAGLRLSFRSSRYFECRHGTNRGTAGFLCLADHSVGGD